MLILTFFEIFILYYVLIRILFYLVQNTLHACLTALLVEGNIMWITFLNTCIITD